MSETKTAPSNESAVPRDSDVLMANIAKLDVALRIRQTHHNSVWEEQKHFTWLISIILSAQAIVLGGAKIAGADKAVIISIASIVGIIIATIGFRVQRIEGVYYQQANANFASAYQAVYPLEQERYYSHKPNKDIATF